MPTRSTVLLLAGLLLVAVNALVSGHWLNVKSAFVNAEGSATAGLSLSSLPGGSTLQRIGDDAHNVKQGVSVAGQLTNVGGDVKAFELTGQGIAKVKNGILQQTRHVNDPISNKPWWSGLIP